MIRVRLCLNYAEVRKRIKHSKGKLTMKTSIQKIRYFKFIRSKVVIGLILASAISLSSLSPALADHGNGHGWDNRGGNRGHQQWRGDRDGYGGYRPIYRQSYSYAQPVYVPPPVYYPPQQSPGISLFFSA